MQVANFPCAFVALQNTGFDTNALYRFAFVRTVCFALLHHDAHRFHAICRGPFRYALGGCGEAYVGGEVRCGVFAFGFGVAAFKNNALKTDLLSPLFIDA